MVGTCLTTQLIYTCCLTDGLYSCSLSSLKLTQTFNLRYISVYTRWDIIINTWVLMDYCSKTENVFLTFCSIF